MFKILHDDKLITFFFLKSEFELEKYLTLLRPEFTEIQSARTLLVDWVDIEYT